MGSSIENEQCSIKCPNCGIKIVKSLQWLAYHRGYICECNAAFDILSIYTQKEIEALDKAIEEEKNKSKK